MSNPFSLFPILGKSPVLEVGSIGSIQLMDGCMLKIKSLPKGMTLEKGKSSTDTILEKGFATKEAKVAKESA